MCDKPNCNLKTRKIANGSEPDLNIYDISKDTLDICHECTEKMVRDYQRTLNMIGDNINNEQEYINFKNAFKDVSRNVRDNMRKLKIETIQEYEKNKNKIFRNKF